MKVIKKKLRLKVLLGIIILMMFCLYSFSYILQNGSGSGYDEDVENSSIRTYTIEILIINGAGYYLKGNLQIQSLLNLVELQDIKSINYDEMNKLINKSMENITLARETYEQLIQLAEITPYNQESIVKLKAFDYRSFMTEMELNSVVFDQVRGYLEKGDITGTFKHTYSKLAAIEDLLKEIKNEILFDRTPGLSLLWKLNETCAESSLFGSYAARVFYAIVND